MNNITLLFSFERVLFSRFSNVNDGCILKTVEWQGQARDGRNIPLASLKNCKCPLKLLS